MRYIKFIPVLICCWLLIGLAQPAVAQLGSVLNTKSAKEDSPDVARIIENAAQSGLSVIVIDPGGNVLSPVPTAPAPAAEEPTGAGMMMETQQQADAFRSALVKRLRNLPDDANELRYVLRASSPDGTLWPYFEVLVISLGLFAIGMVAERFIYGMHFARHIVQPRIRENPQGYREKMPFLLLRFVAGVIGTLFSMLVAYIIGYAIFGAMADTAIQYTALLINIGYFGARFVTGLWRMILSPYLPQYRIPMLNNHDARKLHLWLSAVVILVFFNLLFSEWIRELGLSSETYIMIGIMLSAITVVLNFALVMANRRAVTGAILLGRSPSEATWPQRTLSQIWVLLVCIYMIFAWVNLTTGLVIEGKGGVPLISAAYAILTTILVVYGVINFLIESGFARAAAIRQRNQAPEADTTAVQAVIGGRLTTFQGLAQRIAGILAFATGLYAFLSIWSESTTPMAGSMPDHLLDIGSILFLGYIAYSAFRIWIDQKIAAEQADMPEGELGDEGGGTSASRLATLLPLFRNFVLIVIVVTVVLIALMEMGVNVGPLFAGAGIVGVAVGFGSQSLVRDIFSGAFFLFDDAFRRGEYIDIGGVKGTVENISVRSFQLRHHLGALHTIPFGEIQVLTNYSRDWVIMKLPLRVTYDTDVEKVRKLIKKLGIELLDDPVIGKDFIQPLKSQGVIEMQDSAMIIRVKFMTKPGDQWLARKKVYEEIRALFEREGIKFAHREVTVRLADGEAAALDAQKKEAVMAAAQASFDEEEAEERGGDDR